MSEEHGRNGDKVIYEVRQQLHDFIAESRRWMTEHDQSAADFRKEIMEQIKDLNGWRHQVNTPVKILSWVVAIFVSGILANLGVRAVKFFDK